MFRSKLYNLAGDLLLLNLSHLPFAGVPLGTILNFLLQLGFREVGSPFALANLDDVQRSIAGDMAQLGLLMPFMYVLLVSFSKSLVRNKRMFHLEEAFETSLVMVY